MTKLDSHPENNSSKCNETIGNDSREIHRLLRETMRREREKLSINQVKDSSRQISVRLSELVPLRRAQTIMGFASINNEVDISEFLIEQQQHGKTVLLPRVEKYGELSAVKFTHWDLTSTGAFGIREPQGDPWPLDSIDVVLIPGLAYDGRGYRLGYGKGYYDRFLPQLKANTFKCGLAYEFQVVNDILPHDHDIPVHWIVTERSELVIDWNYF